MRLATLTARLFVGAGAAVPAFSTPRSRVEAQTPPLPLIGRDGRRNDLARSA